MTPVAGKEQHRPVVTPAQLRGARAMLNWTRKELRAVSGVSVDTIKNIECGKFSPQATTVEKITQAFSAQGIEFIGQLGVTFTSSERQKS